MTNKTNVKIILLNGPAGSGKDTAAFSVKRNLLFQSEHDVNVHVVKFAEVLKRCTHEAYGLENLNHDHYEKVKEMPLDDFFGLSPRDAYIKMSEHCIKPGIHKEHFGMIFHKKMSRKIIEGDDLTNIFLVSDSGFAVISLPPA